MPEMLKQIHFAAKRRACHLDEYMRAHATRSDAHTPPMLPKDEKVGFLLELQLCTGGTIWTVFFPAACL